MNSSPGQPAELARLGYLRLVHTLLGGLLVPAGLAAVFMPAIFVPDGETSAIALHLTQEQGAAFVFVGSMALWCARRPCRPLHGGLVVFWVLFGGIHRGAYSQGERTLLSPLVNSLPPTLLVVGSLARFRSGPVPVRP